MSEENPLNLPNYYKTRCVSAACGISVYPYKIEFSSTSKCECAYYECTRKHTKWAIPIRILERNKPNEL